MGASHVEQVLNNENKKDRKARLGYAGSIELRSMNGR